MKALKNFLKILVILEIFKILEIIKIVRINISGNRDILGNGFLGNVTNKFNIALEGQISRKIERVVGRFYIFNYFFKTFARGSEGILRASLIKEFIFIMS